MSRTGRPPRRAVAGVLAGLLLPGVLAACSGEEAVHEAAHPSVVEPIGDSGLHSVVLTSDAAHRLDLETHTAEQQGEHVVVPYAALIYDGEGAAWVYTAPEPLTFIRAAVDVDRIEGGRVLLRGGVPAGTQVVTVGSAEVYGSELGIEGSH
jgi:hypothetical protein